MMQHELPPATYESFFLREFPRLVSVLTARTGDRATAEDLAQDALLQAEQRWHRVVGLDNPAMWVRPTNIDGAVARDEQSFDSGRV
jgi:DNA-directed RNA polymerase specialized sigma24 family protein